MSILEDFLKNHAHKLDYYAIRDNCGFAALDLIEYAKEKEITLTRIKGFFQAEEVVCEKKDFTPAMKKEFMTTNLDWDSAEDRKQWIEGSRYKEEWKLVPHYWTIDSEGNILDPSGALQFVETKLSPDLASWRYKPES